MGDLKAGTRLRQHNAKKEASHPVGSLGGLMDQGAEPKRSSASSLPELAMQGPSTKRASQTHVPLRRLLEQ